MPPPDLEVDQIVRRSHLHRAGAERRVDELVGDDRDAPVGQRQRHGLTDQVRVPVVVRMHGDRRVAEHRLGAGRDHDDRRVTLSVADGDQLAVVVGVVDLDVAQRGEAARAPVDDPLGAVDQIVVVQPLEDRPDRGRESLVHGEAFASPVDAVAEAPHLAEDLAAVLLLPRPHLRHELLAGVVVLALAFGLADVPLDERLGGDPGVIHAGQPQRLEALHPLAADQRVHQRVAERVADVQAARDVRRRQHDRVRRLVAVDVGREVAALDPPLVQRTLYLRRCVTGRQIRSDLGAALGHESMVRTGWAPGRAVIAPGGPRVSRRARRTGRGRTRRARGGRLTASCPPPDGARPAAHRTRRRTSRPRPRSSIARRWRPW